MAILRVLVYFVEQGKDEVGETSSAGQGEVEGSHERRVTVFWEEKM